MGKLAAMEFSRYDSSPVVHLKRGVHCAQVCVRFYRLGHNTVYFVENQSIFLGNVRRFIPEYITLHNHLCDNLKSYKCMLFEISLGA
jgi:hypothetical protein